MKPKIRWLFFLILILMLVTTVTLSRYTSTVSGTGQATVAAVDMSATQLSFTAQDLKPGGSRSFDFSVVNFTDERASDVAQSYTISVASTGNLPLSFRLTSTDGTDSDHALAKNASGYVWTGGALPHTTKTTHNYLLTATWASGENDPGLADEIDLITVTVDSVQVTPEA